jgi:hypothetical protein
VAEKKGREAVTSVGHQTYDREIFEGKVI